MPSRRDQVLLVHRDCYPYGNHAAIQKCGNDMSTLSAASMRTARADLGTRHLICISNLRRKHGIVRRNRGACKLAIVGGYDARVTFFIRSNWSIFCG